ncbi:hypothetical protein RFI_27907, partial [Reticulomyxa filosa]
MQLKLLAFLFLILFVFNCSLTNWLILFICLEETRNVLCIRKKYRFNLFDEYLTLCIIKFTFNILIKKFVASQCGEKMIVIVKIKNFLFGHVLVDLYSTFGNCTRKQKKSPSASNEHLKKTVDPPFSFFFCIKLFFICKLFQMEAALRRLGEIKQQGNTLFGQKDYASALSKYEEALNVVNFTIPNIAIARESNDSTSWFGGSGIDQQMYFRLHEHLAEVINKNEYLSSPQNQTTKEEVSV